MKIIKEYNTFIFEKTNNKREFLKSKIKNFFTGSVSKNKAIEIIESHPMKNKLYQNLLKTNPEKAEKLLQFIMKNPNVTYFTWNTTENKFVVSGYLSMRENLNEMKKPL